MSTVRIEALSRGAAEIPLQPASYDIWDKKYRLKTQAGRAGRREHRSHLPARRQGAGRCRRPRAEKQKYWYERFLWALRRGAIPAGRVTSNAGALEHKPATSTINCTVSGTIEDSMDGILDKVHEAGPDAEGRLRHRLRILDAASARRLRLGRRRVHVRADVVHGYLRQDVLHGQLRRRPPRRADGHVRRRPSRCQGFHPRQARGRPPAPVQSVAADHRRLHAGGRKRCRLAAACSRSTSRKRTRSTSTMPTQVIWREWPTHKNYVTRDDGLVACKIYGHDPRQAPVGHDHDLDVRLRRAGLHPDRPRQRDEQQLVVREHPRDQSRAASSRCRRTARACSARSI